MTPGPCVATVFTLPPPLDVACKIKPNLHPFQSLSCSLSLYFSLVLWCLKMQSPPWHNANPQTLNCHLDFLEPLEIEHRFRFPQASERLFCYLSFSCCYCYQLCASSCCGRTRTRTDMLESTPAPVSTTANTASIIGGLPPKDDVMDCILFFRCQW